MFTPISYYIVKNQLPAKLQLKTIRPIITLVTYSFLYLLKWSKHEGTLTFHAPLFDSTVHLTPQFVKISVSISKNKSIPGPFLSCFSSRPRYTTASKTSQHTLGDSQKDFFNTNFMETNKYFKSEAFYQSRLPQQLITVLTFNEVSLLCL